MPCFHPLTGIIDAEKKTENGKPLIHIMPSSFDASSIQDQSAIVKVPCGQCIGCRIDYSRDWANRLMLELQDHDPDRCFFVTLTYDDDHIKEHCNAPKGFYSLNKRDLQLFMKRLRKSIEPDLCRFYAVGEYGSSNLRPHFHLILFNVPLNSYRMTDLKRSGLGYMYRSSELLEQVWPYGFNVVAPVTWESCAYTARYMMKKLKGEDGVFYDLAEIERPFSLASRKPGIGKGYFDRLADFSEVSFINVGSGDGVKQITPPAYFERLYKKVDEEAAAQRAAFRKALAIERRQLELAGTDVSEEDYLRSKESSFKKRTKILGNTREI